MLVQRCTEPLLKSGSPDPITGTSVDDPTTTKPVGQRPARLGKEVVWAVLNESRSRGDRQVLKDLYPVLRVTGQTETLLVEPGAGAETTAFHLNSAAARNHVELIDWVGVFVSKAGLLGVVTQAHTERRV